VIPSDLLHTLLRRSGKALDSGLGQIRSMVDDLMQSSLGQLKRLVQSPRKQELDDLRRQLRRLEHRLSVLLDDLDDDARSRAQPSPDASGEVSSSTPLNSSSQD
jgi:hypothetical protein